MYQHVRPSHLERHLLGVFLFPAADQVLDTSYITWSSADCRSTQARGRPFLARERVPAAHPAPSVAEACKNAICSLA